MKDRTVAPKIRRNLDTPESRVFWESIKKSAEGVKGWPAWMKAGINICHTRYEVAGGQPCPYSCCNSEDGDE